MELFSRLTNTGRRFYASRLFRTASVGVVGVGVQTAVFEIIGVYLQLVSLSTAALIGSEFGILSNFILNNYFSFQEHQRPSMMRLAKFHLVVLGSVFLQWLFVFVAERMTHDLFIIHVAYGAGILLGFIWNYNWYRLWVWKKHPILE